MSDNTRLKLLNPKMLDAYRELQQPDDPTVLDPPIRGRSRDFTKGNSKMRICTLAFSARIASSILLVIAFATERSHGGAWTLPERTGEAIQTTRYQSRTSESQFEYNPYLEWGLTDSVTLGANGGYRLTTSKTTGSSSTGLGYAEGFARFRLLQGSGGVLSFQALGGSSARGLGAQSDGSAASTEGRIGWGYGSGEGKWGSFYIDTGAAFREFFGKVGNEFRADASLGWKFSPAWIALGQVFLTRNLRENLSPQDYDSTVLQFSVIAPIASQWKFQAGVAPTVAGKQIERATTFFLGAWFAWDSPKPSIEPVRGTKTAPGATSERRISY